VSHRTFSAPEHPQYLATVNYTAS